MTDLLVEAYYLLSIINLLLKYSKIHHRVCFCPFINFLKIHFIKGYIKGFT